MNKDRLTRNQDNVFQFERHVYPRTVDSSVLIQYKADTIVISSNVTWSRHNIAEEILIHSFTPKDPSKHSLISLFNNNCRLIRLNKANIASNSCQILDLDISFSQRKFNTRVYDKIEDFSFTTIHPFQDDDIPLILSYGFTFTVHLS